MAKRTIDPGKCRALIEALPDAAIIADAAGRIVMANTLTHELFGYARDELIGEPVEMLAPERLRAAHARGRSGWFSKPTTRSMGLETRPKTPQAGQNWRTRPKAPDARQTNAEVRERMCDYVTEPRRRITPQTGFSAGFLGLNLTGRRRDGSEFPVDISLSPIETEQGIMAIATVRDITAVKHGEALLLEEKQRLETVTDFANCAFFALDAETRVVYANKVAEKWFGPIKRIKGKLCRRVLQLVDPETECAGLEVKRTGKSVRRETFAKMADGTERYVFLDATPVKTVGARSSK